MTARVLRVFTHEHNRREVARQDLDFAEEHFREVCRHRDPLNPEHNRRFHDAAAKREAARDRWLETLRG